MALLVMLLLGLDGGTLTPADLMYPGARRLLTSRTRGSTLELTWACYATADAPERVAAHYERDARLIAGGWRMHGAERGFCGAHEPELHVAVFPAEDLGRHSTCRAPLEAGERTVLQVTLGVERRALDGGTP